MWSSGDVVVVRYLNEGRISFARPVIVVEDGETGSVLFLPAGTPTKRRLNLDGTPIPRELGYEQRFARPWRLGDGSWGDSQTLLLTPGDAAHAIWLFWSSRWDFRGWYVNLQAPSRRSAVGFDTVDHVLDLWVEPELTWSWKDEHELEAAVGVGRFTPAEAAEIRAEGARVVEAFPFPTGWEDWRPDPAWPVPQLPPDWDAL